MAIVAPDPKLVEYEALLSDNSRPVSELDLRRILKYLENISKRISDHEASGAIFGMMALCFMRMGQPEKSLGEFRLALQRLREPTLARAVVLTNQAAALGALGRYIDAANSSIEAAKIPQGYTNNNLCNLARALHCIGDFDAATDIFQEAVRLSDLTSPSSCLRMANDAALLSFDHEAVELFARFIIINTGSDDKNKSATDIIREASEYAMPWLRRFPPLYTSVRRAMAMTDELNQILLDGAGECESSNDATESDVLDVYEASRRLREAAVAKVIMAHDHAQD